MRKFKISSLVLASLILGITLCLTVAMAKADNTNPTNTNERQVNTNENRDNANLNNNDNQPNLIGTRDNVNSQENDNENINENANENSNDNVNKNTGGDNQLNGAAHRSAVANFVQSLLNVANREQGGIGAQVKVIAQAQNDTKDQEAAAIDKINKRSKVTTFLIGSDYKTLGQLRSAMVTTQNQINQLNNLLAQTTDATTKATLQAQIQVLTAEQQKINDFIKVNDSKFSLFGWLVKLFNK